MSRPNRLGAAITGIRTQHQATKPPTNPRPNGDETATSTGQKGSLVERQFSDSECLERVSDRLNSDIKGLKEGKRPYDNFKGSRKENVRELYTEDKRVSGT